MHQGKYTKDIVKKFNMNDSKPMSTPMGTTVGMDADEDGEPVDQKEYRFLSGRQFTEFPSAEFARVFLWSLSQTYS